MKETLSEYVRRVMREKKLTFKDVEERSRNTVKIGTVSDIVQERTTNPTVSTLKALAKGLGQPEPEVFAVARGESLTEDPEYRRWKYASLFDDSNKLTPEQMRRFETIMDIARREVTRMLEEQELETLHRSRRIPTPPKAEEVSQAKEKKRA
jgi:transcriptional regulator with XRE-family HTH domain